MNQHHEGRELETLIHRCSTQAKWHQQQYRLLKYYEQYYMYLLRYQQYYEQFDSNAHAQNTEDEPMCSNEEDSGDVSYANNEGNGEQKQPFIQREHNMNVQHESASPRKKKKKRKKSTKKQQPPTNKLNNESESELELDEGFKEFLKQSERFRKERDAMKRQSSTTAQTDGDDGNGDERNYENIEIEYVDILRKGPDGTVLPPTAQNRKKLYEEKYGTGSGTTILSLETALQWKYNKFFDQNSPVMWPAIPLRFT